MDLECCSCDKEGQSVRFRVDYRVLNSLIKKDAYPLPGVDDCLDSLSGCKWFCMMILNSRFWQFGLSEKSCERTVFSTSLGLFHPDAIWFSKRSSNL